MVYESGKWLDFCQGLYPAGEHPDTAASTAQRMYESMVLRNDRDVPGFYLGKDQAFEPKRDTLLVGYTGMPQNGFVYKLNMWSETD